MFVSIVQLPNTKFVSHGNLIKRNNVKTEYVKIIG